jgi:hypothetical protein
MIPFHYSFFVKDLASARHFYGEVLGCREGRSTTTWVDFDFFGHQLSCHITGTPPALQNTGEVDGIKVPMPHFGAIVPWTEFPALATRVEASGVTMIVSPRGRFEGQPGEQRTMFFLDNSGNAIEMKAFKDPSAIYADFVKS